MEEFFPSEIARLVLGYLKEMKCLKAWEMFLEESSCLQEYFHLYKKGKQYSTNVNGKSLLDIFNEYYALKSKAVKNDDDIEFCGNLIKGTNKVILKDIVKDAMDLMFQKYISSFASNSQHKSVSSSGVTQEVHSSELTDNFIDLEVEGRPASNELESNEEISVAHKDKRAQNVAHEEKRAQNTAHKEKRAQNTLTTVEPNLELNIADKNIDPIGEQCNSKITSESASKITNTVDSDYMHLQKVIKVENDSSPISNSLTEIQQENSISNVIKSPVNNDNRRTKSNSVYDKSNIDLPSTRNKLDVVAKSSYLVNPALRSNKENAEKATEIQAKDGLELEIVDIVKPDLQYEGQSNSSNQIALTTSFQNSTSTKEQPIDNNNVEISQTSLYNIQNTVGQVDGLVNNIGSTINQSGYTLTSAPFPTIPAYIFPSLTSSGSLLQNNAQYSIVINGPVSSWKDATVSNIPLTLPAATAVNTLGPVLTAIDSITTKELPSVPGVSINSISNPVFTTVDTVNSQNVSTVSATSSNGIKSPMLTAVDTVPACKNSLTIKSVSGSTRCTASTIPTSNSLVTSGNTRLKRGRSTKESCNTEKKRKEDKVEIDNIEVSSDMKSTQRRTRNKRHPKRKLLSLFSPSDPGKKTSDNNDSISRIPPNQVVCRNLHFKNTARKGCK